MLKSFVEKIIGLAPVEQHDVDGRTFLSRECSEVVPRMIDGIEVHTLQGVADYLKDEMCDISIGDAMIHVIDPYTVRVLDGAAGDIHREREVYLRSKRIHGEFNFGKYYDQEEMMINLMTMFEQTETLKEVRSVVAGIVATNELKASDDGLSQEVQVKKGVSRVEPITIKNPIMLAPIRTFTEIEQVESPHVLRIRCIRDEIEVAIFEAGGGQWKNEAITKIKTWLREQIGEVKILG